MGFFKKGEPQSKMVEKKVVKKVKKTIEPKVAQVEEPEEVEEETEEQEVEIEEVKKIEEIKEEIESIPGKNTIWSVEEITTATTPVIYNSKTKEELNLYQALAEILNRTED